MTTASDRRQPSTSGRRDQITSATIFISKASIFCPDIPACAPPSARRQTPPARQTPACRTAQAHPAKHHFAQLHQPHGQHAAQRVSESCMAFTAPTGRRGHGGKRTGPAAPKRSSLPGPGCRRWRRRSARSAAGCLRLGQRQHWPPAQTAAPSPHTAPYPGGGRPPLGQRHGIARLESKIASICEITQLIGVFKRMGRVGVENPPPLVPNSLMASCEATGPSGQRLLAAGQRGHRQRGRPALHHALTGQRQRQQQRQRRQQVYADSGSDRPRNCPVTGFPPGKAAHQHAGRRCSGRPEHLRRA